VGWEKRERGGPYYTRSRRVNGRVVREYVGGGDVGEAAAQLDEAERRHREEKAAYRKEEKERLRRDADFLSELEATAEVLTRAHLIAAGFCRHKGEWRRPREKRSA
jgi:hypothetical protein